jgi:hypothetical protein
METFMAIAKVDGNAYSAGNPPNRVGSGSDNNGGVIAGVKGGTISSGKFSKVGVTRTNTTVFASTPYDGDDAGKSISAGSFAHDHPRGVILRSTTEIAGQSNNVLRSAGSSPILTRSINSIESASTVKTASAIRSNKYNRYTGQYEAGYPQTSTDSFGNDDAARSSRSAPGEFAYTLGKSAVQADYPAKNG